eukprot:730140-Pyramimonas_sp.AAC.1
MAKCAPPINDLPHLPGGIELDRDNDSIEVDLITLADCAGNLLVFLNVVDLASAFTLYGTVSSRHPSVVFSRLLQMDHTVWATIAGDIRGG